MRAYFLAAFVVSWGASAVRTDFGDLEGDRKPQDEAMDKLMAELDDLVGLDNVKEQMKGLIAQVNFNMERARLGLPDIGGQSLHMSFLGNPGTGKTVVARIVGELLVSMGAIKRAEGKRGSSPGGVVTEVSRADLVAEYTGHTAPKVQKVIKKALGGVLFIDEAYALVQGDSDSFGREAVDTLIKEMEDKRDQVIVILAGYQTEMATFLAANPGFKSRVAFQFAFPDYTCPELVQIGELLLKSKHVALTTGGDDNPCSGSAGLASCPWLLASIKLQTGCCSEKDCEDGGGRANGNGRSVRNILESSYRAMARRTLNTYTHSALSEYDKKVRPKVRGDGKAATPDPALDCGGEFEKARFGGPYEDFQSVPQGADVRCAFQLLEEQDLKASLGKAVAEQLDANCMKAQEPVASNVTSILDQDQAATSLDWEALHRQIFDKRQCKEPQELLEALAPGSLLEKESGVGCNRVHCKSTDSCKLKSLCGDCPICTGRRKPSRNPHRPAAPTGQKMDPKRLKCEVCKWARNKYGAMPEFQRPDVLKYPDVCKDKLRRSGLNLGQVYVCYGALSRTMDWVKLWGADFGCNSALTLDCDDRGKVRDLGGGGSLLRGHIADRIGGRIGTDTIRTEAMLPVKRPGSKVAALMDELNALVGLKGVKAGMAALSDAVEFDMWRKHFLGDAWSLLGQSFHMRFLGNPGTGKTVVARIVGKILIELGVVKGASNADFVFKEVSRGDLVAGYVGKTAPKVQEAVKSASGGVLFIDEAYSLIQGSKDTFGQEAVDTLIKEIEDHRDEVIVIFAGYHKEMEAFFESNPGFQSRVPFRFEFSDYSCEELGQISQMQLEKQGVKATPNALPWLDTIISSKTGCCTQEDIDGGTCAGSTRDNGNGRTVRNVLESALRAMSVRVVSQAAHTGNVDKALVTELADADAAAVGGELISETLRATCKASEDAIPDLDNLAQISRILALPDYSEALTMAGSDCSGATAMLEATLPVAAATANAMDIKISEKEIAAVFDELNELIGLTSVKRAMYELYGTVKFGKLRQQAGLEPLSSQSFHMRFLGNPGTGKTVVARIVGRILVKIGAIELPKGRRIPAGDTIFNEVSRSDLVARYVGQTANKTTTAVEQSLGGVLFIDEAYSLVQSDRDTFGQEAVDTLIKQMEDKRRNVVVICAGYHDEMETFFDSNPGFKSRVPFIFHFEDYTCPQLGEIGKLQLGKKELTLPRDLTSYDQSVRFSTGCCDTLDECEEAKDKGNGRAIRNAIEAAIRAMAMRLSGSSETTRSAYSTLVADDFTVVLDEMVNTRLGANCGGGGPLQKTLSALGETLGFSRDLPGKLDVLARQVRQIVAETAMLKGMAGLSEDSQSIGEQCVTMINSVSENLEHSLHKMCDDGGLFDILREKMQSDLDGIDVQSLANMMSTAIDDQGSMMELLTSVQQTPSATAGALVEVCDSKLAEIRGSKFSVSFDSFVKT